MGFQHLIINIRSYTILSTLVKCNQIFLQKIDCIWPVDGIVNTDLMFVNP